MQNPECVAVGECGLDYNRNFSDPEDQKDVFERHVNTNYSGVVCYCFLFF